MILECLNLVYIYTYTYAYTIISFILEIGEWKTLRTSGELIDARHNHACEIVGRSLIIHGGLNDRGKYLDDLWELNLSIYIYLCLIIYI